MRDPRPSIGEMNKIRYRLRSVAVLIIRLVIECSNLKHTHAMLYAMATRIGLAGRT